MTRRWPKPTGTAISTSTTSPCSPATARAGASSSSSRRGWGHPREDHLLPGQPPVHPVQPDGELPGHHAERVGRCPGILLLDTYLAPFVKTDHLTQKEVKQCIQSFVFGVNTPSRWGTQAPFSNITLDWTVPKRSGEPARHRGRQGEGFHLRRLQEGNGHGEQGVHRDHDRGRRQRPGLPVPHPHLLHHQGLRLVRHGEQPPAL